MCGLSHDTLCGAAEPLGSPLTLCVYNTLSKGLIPFSLIQSLQWF